MPASGAELRLSVRRVDGGTQLPQLNAEGTLLTGCQENGKYEFQLSDSLGASTVLVDDVPLPAVSGTTNCWSWKPGFYAGSVVAEVFDGMARLVGSWTIDVSPNPAKLGRDAFLPWFGSCTPSIRSLCSATRRHAERSARKDGSPIPSCSTHGSRPTAFHSQKR